MKTLNILLALFIICVVIYYNSKLTNFLKLQLQIVTGQPTQPKTHRQKDNIQDPTSIFDCTTWTSIPYKQDKNDPSFNISDDLQGNQNRLESWNKNWVNSTIKNGPRSGHASTLAGTKLFRQGLHKIVDFLKTNLTKNVIHILDASCGDMTFMRVFLRERKDVQFTGYDLVPAAIEENKQAFANESWEFKQHDWVKQKINQKFDLIILRNTAGNIGLLESIQAYHNFYQTGSLYFMSTNHPGLARNTHITEGRKNTNGVPVRLWNLIKYPYRFGAPICQTKTTYDARKYFGLWPFSSLEMFEEMNADKIRPFEQ